MVRQRPVLPLLGLLLGLLAVAGQGQEKEGFCAAWPGTEPVRESVQASDGKMHDVCSCVCDPDPTKLGYTEAKCLTCPKKPDGLIKNAEWLKNPAEVGEDKACILTTPDTVFKVAKKKLRCPSGEPPVLDGDGAVCVDHVPCAETPDGLQKGEKQAWGPVECGCERKTPIRCPDRPCRCASRDAKGAGDIPKAECGECVPPKLLTATMECEYDEPKELSKSDYRARVAIAGFKARAPGKDLLSACGRSQCGEGFAKEVPCPLKVEIDRNALFCGPRTKPYMQPFVETAQRLLSIKNPAINDKIRGDYPPAQQCIVNCASLYAKLQECSVTDCDMTTVELPGHTAEAPKTKTRKEGGRQGDTQIDEYLASKDDASVTFAVIAEAANNEAIPGRLYTSRDSGTQMAAVKTAIAHLAKEAEKDGAVNEGGLNVASPYRWAQAFFEGKSTPDFIPCRWWAWNAMRDGLDKGKTHQACWDACIEKYPALKKDEAKIKCSDGLGDPACPPNFPPPPDPLGPLTYG